MTATASTWSWTANEEDYLRKNYPTASPAAVAESLGRSIPAVRTKARYLGICKKPRADGQPQKKEQKRRPPTLSQLLLDIADSLPATFTEEELVMSAWKRYPKAFGMRQFDYPDTNRVRTVLCGKTGMVARGIFGRIRPGVLRMVREQLPTGLDEKITTFWITAAARKDREDQRKAIVIGEAEAFWNLVGKGRPLEQVAACAKLFRSGESIEHRLLLHLSDWMWDRFGRLLEGVGAKES